jgi:hypothetical protein
MVDMAATIAPKSDQLNADDLIAGPRTVVITQVVGSGNADQPVNVHFDGDQGKPYKPCKGMRRIMVEAWGPDASQYAGRAMTLFRNAAVLFGGAKVGGIQISHMSHIDRDFTTALTVSKAKRSPYTVKRLADAPTPQSVRDAAADWSASFIAAVDAAESDEALQQVIAKTSKRMGELASKRHDLHQQCQSAITAALAKHQAPTAAPAEAAEPTTEEVDF